MNWLAPAAFAGLLALAAPVLAHLLGRREPRTIPFAATRFVEDAKPHVDQRPQLRDLPLFALRVLAMVFLVLAFARPVTLEDRELPIYGAPHDAVLLVDTSASMLRVEGEAFEAELALERARELVENLPPGSRIAWLVSDPDGPSRELQSPDPDQLVALERFVREDARPGGWPLSDALERALGLLPDDDRERVIYAISDPTAKGLASLPTQLAEGVRVYPVSTRPEETGPIDNLGLHDLSWEVAKDIDPRAIRVGARLRRSSLDESASRDVEAVVAFEVDGEEQSRTSVVVAPGEGAEVEFTHSLIGDHDSARVALRLVEPTDDPFAPDNLRERWVSTDAQIEVSVVNGDPSDRRSHDEVYFLVTALREASASTQGSLRVDLRGTTPDQLEREFAEQGARALANTDVLVLANVENPSPPLAAAIRARVEAGMGLWISVGGRVGVSAYNDRFDALLPLRLRGASLAGTAPGRKQARFEGMSPAVLSHPLFKGRSEDLALSGAKTERRMLLEPDPKRDADVALSYASGAPALLTREVGRGRVALLTTSLDRDWSDLAIRPGFVPLVTDTIAWLAGDAQGAAMRAVEVDAPVFLPGKGSVRIEGPSGLTARVDLEDGALRFERTDQPGLYLARPLSVASDASPSSLETRFAVDVPTSESELATQALPAAETPEGQARLVGQRPRWRGLLWLVALILLAEGALRVWMERRSPGA
jgi:hypothetical protein